MEPKKLKRTLCLISAVVLLGTALTSCAEDGAAQPADMSFSAVKEEEAPFSVSDISAGDDFYGYCNAAELMKMRIPEDKRSSGTFSDIDDIVQKQLKEIIHETADGNEEYPAGSNEQLIRDLYRLAYDTYTRANDTAAYDEKLARGILDEIDGVGSVGELIAVWKKLGTEYAVFPVIAPAVSPDLYDSSANTLYIDQTYGIGNLRDAVKNEWSATALRNQLQEYLTKTGVDTEQAKQRATQMTFLLLDIGSVTRFYNDDETPDVSENWYPFTAAELSERLVNISSEDITGIFGLEQLPERIALGNEKQFFMIDSLLDEAHLGAWKDLTRCSFVDTYRMSLPVSCGGITMERGIKPDESAENIVQSVLAKELGELYAQRYFGEEIRWDITDMCGEIIEEYRKLISGSEYITDEGKKALISKLDNMPCFIGADAPHETDPADAERIGSSLFETDIRENVRELKHELSLLGEPAEKNGFLMMAPQTVNACYDPQANCFTITAAILNPPFYDKSADHAVNLGAIGTVIGHEISHAFDDNGMKYDADGCYRPEWIPEADRARFKELSERAVNYYNDFTVFDTYHIKGKKTLGENLADISGVQCALAIAGTPEKQKLVFESYANTWKELLIDSDAKDQVRWDVHSPGPVRINAVVACFDEFYSIYGVSEGDKLYVAPSERIRRW